MCIFTELTSVLTIFVHFGVSKNGKTAKYYKNGRIFDKKHADGGAVMTPCFRSVPTKP